jgi:hypothetical protein
MAQARQSDETQLLDDDFYVETRAVRLQGLWPRQGGEVTTRRAGSSPVDGSLCDTIPGSPGVLVVCPGTPHISQTLNNFLQQSLENGDAAESGVLAARGSQAQLQRAAHGQLPSNPQEEGSWVSASEHGEEPLVILPPAGLESSNSLAVQPDARERSRGDEGPLPLGEHPLPPFPTIPSNNCAGETLLEHELSPRTLQPAVEVCLGGDIKLPDAPAALGAGSSTDDRDTSSESSVSVLQSQHVSFTAEAPTLTPRRIAAATADAPPLQVTRTEPPAAVTAKEVPGPPSFVVGDAVEARWGKQWYPATVFLLPSKAGGRVVVKWRDGKPEQLQLKDVRWPNATAQAETPRAKDRGATGALVTASQLVAEMDLEDAGEGRSTRRLRAVGAPVPSTKLSDPVVTITVPSSGAQKRTITGKSNGASGDSSASGGPDAIRNMVAPDAPSSADRTAAPRAVVDGSSVATDPVKLTLPAKPSPLPMFSEWFIFIDDAFVGTLPAQTLAVLRKEREPPVLLEHARDVITCCNAIAASRSKRGSDGISKRRVAIVASSSTDNSCLLYAGIACGAVLVTDEWLRACFMLRTAVDPVPYLHPIYAREGLAVALGQEDSPFLSPVPHGRRALSGKQVLFAGGFEDQVQQLLLASGASVTLYQHTDHIGTLVLPDFTYTTPGKRARAVDPGLAEVPLLEVPFIKSTIRKWVLAGLASVDSFQEAQRHGSVAIAALRQKRMREDNSDAQAIFPSIKDDGASLPVPASRRRPPPLEPLRSQHGSPSLEEAPLHSTTIGDVTVSLGQDYYVNLPPARMEAISNGGEPTTRVVLARVVKISTSPTLLVHVRPYEFVGLELMHVGGRGSQRVRRGVSVQLGQQVLAVPPSDIDVETALFVLDEEMAHHVYYLVPAAGCGTAAAECRGPESRLPVALDVEKLMTPNMCRTERPNLLVDERSFDFRSPGMHVLEEPPSPAPQLGAGAVMTSTRGGAFADQTQLKWASPPQMRGGELYFTRAMTLDSMHGLEVGGEVTIQQAPLRLDRHPGGPDSSVWCGVVCSLKRLFESRMLVEVERSTDHARLVVETEMRLVEKGPPPVIAAINVQPAAAVAPLVL